LRLLACRVAPIELVGPLRIAADDGGLVVQGRRADEARGHVDAADVRRADDAGVAGIDQPPAVCVHVVGGDGAPVQEEVEGPRVLRVRAPVVLIDLDDLDATVVQDPGGSCLPRLDGARERAVLRRRAQAEATEGARERLAVDAEIEELRAGRKRVDLALRRGAERVEERAPVCGSGWEREHNVSRVVALGVRRRASAG
jgi:hypothetical protein